MLKVDKAEVMIGKLFRGEEIAENVDFECHKILAEPIPKVIARSFFQSEVQVIVNHAFDWGVRFEFGLV